MGCVRPEVKEPKPELEGFAFPAPSFGEATPAEVHRLEQGWSAVLLGETARAEGLFRRLLKKRPGFVPAEAGLAYTRLRAGRDQEAGQAFETILRRRPDYVPALLGGATAALRLGHPEAALALYRRIPSGAGGLPEPVLRRRLGEVRLQATERRLADAREALGEGDGERAIELYRRALADAPELAGLRLELAELLLEAGDTPEAIAVLDEDTTGDRQLLLRLGDLLAASQEYSRAFEAYRRILQRDPRDEEAARRSQETRWEMELLRMPEEYRRIFQAPTITRADLAALVAVRLTALSRLSPSGNGAVAVDISGSWAREHIIRVLALDIINVYPNHTFQPAATVRRGDLARAVKRILDLLGYPATPTPALADMSTTNVYYPGAARAVAAGLMDLTPEGAFQAWRPVAGSEAASVLDALTRLVGP